MKSVLRDVPNGMGADCDLARVVSGDEAAAGAFPIRGVVEGEQGLGAGVEVAGVGGGGVAQEDSPWAPARGAG